MALQNDEENKFFCIGFRTSPPDETGLPHIMEHSVLCGSMHYPAKEPFVELNKGSLSTFLNAFTGADRTLYPVDSRNPADFRNLVEVYMDAVQHLLKKSSLSQMRGVSMVNQLILAVTSCFLVLSGCSIGRTTVRPDIYGQFEIVAPVILDTMTGLEWQVGPDQNMNWYEAKAWVEGLGGNWRMPSRAELQGLWNAGISSDNWGPFENNGYWVWSGEVRDSSSVWGFHFYGGAESWGHPSTTSLTRAFAVRSP